MDAGWGLLIRFTEYKGARITERLVVRVPSAYSTKECLLLRHVEPRHIERSRIRLCRMPTVAGSRHQRRSNCAEASIHRAGRAGLARTQACRDLASATPEHRGGKPGRGSGNYIRREIRKRTRRWKPTTPVVGGGHQISARRDQNGSASSLECAAGRFTWSGDQNNWLTLIQNAKSRKSSDSGNMLGSK